MPTPLALFFYGAFKESGRKLESVAKAAGVSVATVWAYINGTRGGRTRNSVTTVRKIAKALDLDEQEALAKTRVSDHSPQFRAVLAAIRADSGMAKPDQEQAIAFYTHLRQRR